MMETNHRQLRVWCELEENVRRTHAVADEDGVVGMRGV